MSRALHYKVGVKVWGGGKKKNGMGGNPGPDFIFFFGWGERGGRAARGICPRRPGWFGSLKILSPGQQKAKFLSGGELKKNKGGGPPFLF